MDQHILNLLDSPDGADRKEAIKLLVKDGSDEALKYLSALYKTETDPEIKQLAVKAGKLIRKRQQENAMFEDDGEMAFEDAIEEDDAPVEVSEMQRTRANSLLELAMDRSVAGDNAAAEKHLIKAFQINPNLLQDDYAVGVAGDIMGISASEVKSILREESTPEGKRKRKRKNSEITSHEGDATWNEAFTDMLIYMLVVGAITFVSTLLYFQFFAQTFASVDQQFAEAGLYSTTDGVEAAASMEAALSFFNTIGIGFSAVAAFSSAIGSLIYLLIWFFVIHFVATTFLSGDGTFRGLVHNTINYYTAFTVAYTLFGVGMFFLMTNSFLTPFSDASILTMSEAELDRMFAENLNNATSMLSLLGLLMFVGFIAFLYFTSKGIGKTYQLGTATGCISQIIAYIVLVGVIFACSCAFSALFASSVSAAFGTAGF
jgi:hypothetical protein